VAKLHFYYSAMNAGKTTTLLQSSHNYWERGMHTLLFTPKIDDRYASGVIASRIGLKAEAIAFEEKFDFYAYMESYLRESEKKISCILVDEAHFLKKEQIYQLSLIVDKLNIPVLAYGLRTDFLGEPFEGSQYLLAWAESLTEIKTICHCGRKATMNLRIDENGKVLKEGEQIQIGGNESYVSTCRKHFLLEQAS